MAAIRHSLQKEVFLPNDERLVGVANVAKASKKTKHAFLCVAVSNDKQTIVTISQVKKTDKDTFKKKASWQLQELKLVDCKDESKPTGEFDLHFEKVYKWVACNISEKNAFIQCLWKLCCQHLPGQKPTFVNIPKALLEESDTVAKAVIGRASYSGESASAVEVEDYQVLSASEEADLECLMAQYDFVVGHADEFTELLARELAELDSANIQAIMVSEHSVQRLMTMLEKGTKDVSSSEGRVRFYDNLLKSVKDSVSRMEEKDTLIKIQNKNNLMLLEVLNNFVKQLHLSHPNQVALLDGDLTSPDGIIACTAAAKALQNAMNPSIHPGLMKTTAYIEQKKLFDELRGKFLPRLSHHLNNLIVYLGNECQENLSFFASDITLPEHAACHKELLPYADLMNWIKVTEPENYKKLAKVYTTSFSKLYEKEIKLFFDLAVKICNRNTPEKVTGCSPDLGLKSTVKQKAFSLLGMDPEQYGEDLDQLQSEVFDKVLERLLSMLEPVCLAEQQFCIKFFGLETDIASSICSQQLSVPQAMSPTLSNHSLSRSGSKETLSIQKNKKQINEVRGVMGELFAVLESELVNFILYFDKFDGFYSMYVLVRLSQHVMSAQDIGSFLSMTFASVLVQAKRNFDTFMQAQIRSIEEAKVSKKSKCGILPFVSNFEKFAQQAEVIFKGSERRTDLDRWYSKLIQVVFDTIVKISVYHQKTPPEVLQMENFHHLFTLFYQLKIPCLEAERKEAKQKYNEALQAYVLHLIGRPLEKLNVFFEGVENKVAQGVKENEVGYQLAFSKLELRKVIKEYPGKEVKSGLESLYKEVEKHLCEEENLLQVVWHSMQDEFIRQYKYIESLIEQCYPDAMVCLEFSIDNILNFFSDIARSH